MLISVVIPCYQSSLTLPTVIKETRSAFLEHPEHEYQIILVNDGSPDGGETYRTIMMLCDDDPKIIGIELGKNYGQECARMAAIPYILGECAVYMDDDGQHPPDKLFLLVEKLSEGYDVVYAKFPSKKHSLFKRATSRAFAGIREFLGVKPRGIHTSSYYAWSKFSINALKEYHSPLPSAGTFLLKVTSRFANVEMPHRKRIAGHSGYSFKKLLSLALNTAVNFSMKPLRVSAALGIGIAGLGFITGLIIAIRRIANPNVVMGYTSLMAVILLLGGIIMLLLGLVGEYIGRIYMTLSDMPQYMIRETRNAAEVSRSEMDDEALSASTE